MGQARRRRLAGENPTSSVKIPLRKRLAGFIPVHHKRVEITKDDGIVYAVNFIRLQTPDGNVMVEETPDGPKPVLWPSIPQPIKRSVLVRA